MLQRPAMQCSHAGDAVPGPVRPSAGPESHSRIGAAPPQQGPTSYSHSLHRAPAPRRDHGRAAGAAVPRGEAPAPGPGRRGAGESPLRGPGAEGATSWPRRKPRAFPPDLAVASPELHRPTTPEKLSQLQQRSSRGADATKTQPSSCGLGRREAGNLFLRITPSSV